MDIKQIEALAIEVANKSRCKKRKVGAVIVNKELQILSTGYNYLKNTTGNYSCEDENGDTLPNVIHAEIVAIYPNVDYRDCTIFVTHKPCKNCQEAIDAVGLKVHIVEQFMKFDAGKLRYNLIPVEATRALAKVLTYGAKKYKPNNWQKAEDTERYIDALYRHLEAWRSGEVLDSESGLSHLSHALTNIAFLVWFEEQNNHQKSLSDKDIIIK